MIGTFGLRLIFRRDEIVASHGSKRASMRLLPDLVECLFPETAWQHSVKPFSRTHLTYAMRDTSLFPLQEIDLVGLYP
jgi:hypothetical protein